MPLNNESDGFAPAYAYASLLFLQIYDAE